MCSCVLLFFCAFFGQKTYPGRSVAVVSQMIVQPDLLRALRVAGTSLSLIGKQSVYEVETLKIPMLLSARMVTRGGQDADD